MHTTEGKVFYTGERTYNLFFQQISVILRSDQRKGSTWGTGIMASDLTRHGILLVMCHFHAEKAKR